MVGEKKQKIHIAARLPIEVVKTIDKLAQDQDRSRSWVINKAVKDYLEYLGYLEDLTPPGEEADAD